MLDWPSNDCLNKLRLESYKKTFRRNFLHSTFPDVLHFLSVYLLPIVPESEKSVLSHLNLKGETRERRKYAEEEEEEEITFRWKKKKFVGEKKWSLFHGRLQMVKTKREPFSLICGYLSLFSLSDHDLRRRILSWRKWKVKLKKNGWEQKSSKKRKQ